MPCLPCVNCERRSPKLKNSYCVRDRWGSSLTTPALLRTKHWCTLFRGWGCGLGSWLSGVLKSRVLVSGFRGCDFKRDGSSAQTERKPQLLNRIRVSVSRGPTTPKRVSQALAPTVGSKRIKRKIKTFITHLSHTHIAKQACLNQAAKVQKQQHHSKP